MSQSNQQQGSPDEEMWFLPMMEKAVKYWYSMEHLQTVWREVKMYKFWDYIRSYHEFEGGLVHH